MAKLLVLQHYSWRVWPNGDRRLQLDKQFYRDLPQVCLLPLALACSRRHVGCVLKVTDEALKELKRNYDRVRELTAGFLADTSKPRVVIVMGSSADLCVDGERTLSSTRHQLHTFA